MANTANSITDNLKKGTTELLILALLENRNMHIYDMIETLEEISGGACRITYPYAAIYRLIDNGYIIECGKLIDKNRRRQYFNITEKGKKYFADMKEQYYSYVGGVNNILKTLAEK